MTLRIAMWSGPRNISTAMMRAFENRPDTGVVDEPFYAAYLAATGAEHPMREAVIAQGEPDWRRVVDLLLGPSPAGRAVFYQKHMTHHMVPAFGRDWIDRVTNAFLIRRPDAVLASYSAKRAEATLADIGVEAQGEIFDCVADRLGRAPPVIDAGDVLRDPPRVLGVLCRALGIEYSARMVRWPPGRRPTDGVWAAHWYGAVERSTGFGAPSDASLPLPAALRPVAAAAWPHYERLARFKLGAA
jgi:hypothetical protein